MAFVLFKFSLDDFCNYLNFLYKFTFKLIYVRSAIGLINCGKWATSWEKLFQLAHPRSMISAFAVRCLDSIVPLLAISKHSRLKLTSIAEQTGLSLTWSQTPKTGFLVTRLKYEKDIWAGARQNLSKFAPSEDSFRSACASTQFDQSLRCTHEEPLGP